MKLVEFYVQSWTQEVSLWRPVSVYLYAITMVAYETEDITTLHIRSMGSISVRGNYNDICKQLQEAGQKAAKWK